MFWYELYISFDINNTKINSKKIFIFLKIMTIQELKLFLVGPIIEFGYDKIKFFQTGKQYDDNDPQV